MTTAYKTKIGHAHLKVRDLQRSIDFYTRFLGLNVTEVVGTHYAFLTAATYHHEIALQNVGPDAPQPPAKGTGLEIYWDTRTQPGGRQFWNGDNAPLDDKTILAALKE